MKSLTKDNFTLYENGVKQQIINFETCCRTFQRRDDARYERFNEKFPAKTYKCPPCVFLDALSPDDRVAVIEFYDKVNVLNDFTTNRKNVVQSISVANGRGGTNFLQSLEACDAKNSPKKANGAKRSSF
ncbi:VWA domain-containing protein [Biomphalaria pfeifferi]|uniref:VWA domain-containing protein n=1 Tax=Biomphalaria pfeifferi TaxID=112525 RepID=A0AAD8APF7_BIOPF|nr:VWA domain-containing protein [Biomphalaria pfeifferi]